MRSAARPARTVTFAKAKSDPDGTSVRIFETTNPFSFLLVVKRRGVERTRPISFHQAHLYRDSQSADVEFDIEEMKAEIERGKTG